jgi:3-oxoacyl-[acyl-carrier-protein] synthase-1
MVASFRPGIPIISTGARTPLGLSAPATAAAVRAGIAAMQAHPFMIDRFGEPMIVTADAQLNVEIPFVDRLIELAISPALEALQPLRESRGMIASVNVLIALPEERPGVAADLKETFCQRFGSYLEKEIRIQGISCHARGHAGGLACFEQALSLVNSGKTELCLVGGVDSYLHRETLEWLDSLDQLHSKDTIWGFCPGEGAGFCLLSSEKLARHLNLTSVVHLLSASQAAEPNRIKTETICIGEGLSETFKKTLSVLPEDSRVSYTICDMNGEPYRANEFGFAMLRSARKFAEEADFQTPADCWGDVGAASGPLFAILASYSAAKGYSERAYTFLWASSENGLRASALLKTRDGRSRFD